MSLVTETKWQRIKLFVSSLSFRLTGMYAGMMLLILVLTTGLAIGSVHYLLLRQLQFDVQVSAQQTMIYLHQQEKITDQVFNGQNILPLVHLVVYDAEGKPFLDNIAEYEPRPALTLDRLAEINRRGSAPLFDGVRVNGVTVYRCWQRWDSPTGDTYYLEFIRSGTREQYFVNLLINQVIMTIIVGMVVAVLAGWLLTKRTLAPLRAMKDPIAHLEVNEMGYRVPVPMVQDEQRELAVVINRALDRLEHGVVQQKQFVSDASHELRTPITVISGYTDMLIRWGAKDEKTLYEGLEAIQAETEYMRQLIERLLFIARASSGALKLELQPVETSDIINSVWDASLLIDRRRHVMEMLVNEPAYIRADEALFKQVLRIFLDNALKYTLEGGTVKLSSQVVDDRLIISIEDDGVGISETDLPHIFTRFYRVDSSRTKDTGGNGLGLAIAKDILGLHQATVEVESELGEGTVFRLVFPIVTEHTS